MKLWSNTPKILTLTLTLSQTIIYASDEQPLCKKVYIKTQKPDMGHVSLYDNDGSHTFHCHVMLSL
jgi:hypothetical protein